MTGVKSNHTGPLTVMKAPYVPVAVTFPPGVVNVIVLPVVIIPAEPLPDTASAGKALIGNVGFVVGHEARKTCAIVWTSSGKRGTSKGEAKGEVACILRRKALWRASVVAIDEAPSRILGLEMFLAAPM